MVLERDQQRGKRHEYQAIKRFPLPRSISYRKRYHTRYALSCQRNHHGQQRRQFHPIELELLRSIVRGDSQHAYLSRRCHQWLDLHGDVIAGFWRSGSIRLDLIRFQQFTRS